MSTFSELLRSLADAPAAPCQDFKSGTAVLRRDTHRVHALAEQAGARLLALGLKPGERVGLAVRDAAEFLPLMHGCLLFGLVSVPLYPPPLFGKTDTYLETLQAILERAQVSACIVDEGLGTLLAPLGSRHRIVERQALPEPTRDVFRPPLATDLAFLQFTSGSTATPRGVRVTHANLMANVHSIMRDGLRADAGDRGVSWLPLYHDMGLVGFGLAPLLTQTPVTFLPTSSFIKNPAVWLQTLSDERATITFAPNFAYELVTRRVEPAGLDLRSVRMWGSGAEPISAATLRAFERRFAPAGVTPGQVAPCYGLAEATLAVTFTAPSSVRVEHVLDAKSYEQDGRVVRAGTGRALEYVSCGAPLPDCQVAIVDPAGELLGEGKRGEIVVSGTNVCEGYFADAAETARVFRDGALHTGDVGYLAQGQLFVTGRVKDVVIVNGRNYDPTHIERIAMRVAGVRLAAAVSWQVDGAESLLIAIEQAGNQGDVPEAVRAAVAAELGLEPRHVLAFAPGSLPRTTSGKLMRSAAQQLCKARLS